MASKTPSPTSKTGTLSPPKLPAKEMIVTRHQSALLYKRQLRQKDRSMTRITQLLKGPSSLKRASAAIGKTTSKTSPKKKKAKLDQNLKESMKNNMNTPTKNAMKNKERVKNEVASKEYYPNNLKRKLDTKKVLLLPKNHLKIINNKRKLGVPRKDIKSSQIFESLKMHTSSTDSSDLCQRTENETKTIWDKTQNPEYSGLSMAELVRLTEDTEDLTDEDLMEILTCPSPVWWEEPPDCCFIEDPIVTTTPSDLRENEAKVKNARVSLDEGVVIEDSTESTSFIMNKKFTSNENITTVKNSIETEDINIPELELKQCDEKFIKKRSKLENLLGDIKRKKHTTVNDLLTSVIDNKNKLTRGMIKEFNPKLSSEIINLGSEMIITDNKAIKKPNQVKDEKENNCSPKFKRKSKTSSESTDDVLSDLSLQDDEILNDLENMSIPIEPNEPETIESSEKDSASDEGPRESHRTVENKCYSNENFKTLPCTIGSKPDENYENIDIEEYLQVTLLKKTNKSAESEIKIDMQNCTKEGMEGITLKIPTELDCCKNSADLSNQTEVKNEKGIKPTSSNVLLEEIPKNLPQLQRNPYLNINNNLTSSPTSEKSGISDGNVTESSTYTPYEEIDTISLTNIKFLTDEELDLSGNIVISDVIENFKDNKSEYTTISEESENNKEISLGDSSNEEENETTDNKKQFFLDLRTTEKQKGVKIESNAKLELQSDVNKENPVDNSLHAKNGTNIHSNETEFVTVYQIVSESEKKDSVIGKKSDDIIGTFTKNKRSDFSKFNTKIDMFYKKCKGVNHECNKNKNNINDNSENESTPENNATSRASTESNDISNPQTNHNTLLTTDNEKENGDLIFCKSCNPNARNSIVVSDKQSVKYCLKCSSIFDTENCEYCVRKVVTNKTKTSNVASKKNNKKHCTNSNAENSDLVKHFTCDLCNFRTSTKNKIRRHLAEHNFEDVLKKKWDHSYATTTCASGNTE